MRKVLIASHGHMASGICSSINVLIGSDYNINCIDAYVEDDNKDFTNEIQNFIDLLGINDEGVIFTDIYGGSVNQKVVSLCSQTNKNIIVITSMNLPVVLEILLHDGKLTKEVIKEIINNSGIRFIEVKQDLTESAKNILKEADFF